VGPSDSPNPTLRCGDPSIRWPQLVLMSMCCGHHVKRARTFFSNQKEFSLEEGSHPRRAHRCGVLPSCGVRCTGNPVRVRGPLRRMHVHLHGHPVRDVRRPHRALGSVCMGGAGPPKSPGFCVIRNARPSRNHGHRWVLMVARLRTYAEPDEGVALTIYTVRIDGYTLYIPR